MSIALSRHALAGVIGFVAVALAAVALLLSVGGASANNASGGVTGPAFFVDGERYRTVLTQTDLPDTAPDSSFDIIYDLGGAQPNVAEAAPGDAGYNGGRWQVHAISFNFSYDETLAAHDLDSSGYLDSDEEIDSALADASSSGATDLGVVRTFECPVIPMPKS